MITIYFDVCCLNRPFDDQTQDRIHLEAEAVLLILHHVEINDWQWIWGEVVNYEIQQTPEPERRTQLSLLTRYANQFVTLNNTMIERAAALQQQGFHLYDALHLACAESAQATVFLTTDDKLLKRAKLQQSHLHIPVKNPLDWLLGGTELWKKPL